LSNGPLPIAYRHYSTYDGQFHTDGHDEVFARIVQVSAPGGESLGANSDAPPPNGLIPIRLEGKVANKHPMQVEVTIGRT
jgi:hypothetical protein